MRLIFLFVLSLFVQESFAQVRQFNSSELKGVRKAFLETENDGTEKLIGFWKFQRTPFISGGVVVLKIENDQLLKVWEDNNTFAFVKDWDSIDLNKDGKLDFVVTGLGRTEHGLNDIIALYLSDERNQYQKQTFIQKHTLYHLTLGDIDGDQQTEIVFTEQFDSHPEGEGCSWLELEVKIGRWQNGDLQVQGTGIYLGIGDEWHQLTLGDTDNDGMDELALHQYDTQNGPRDKPALGRSILIYDLHSGIKLIDQIEHLDTEKSWNPRIAIDRIGQILEFRKGSIAPTVLSPNGGLSKIASLDIPEIDLAEWEPIQVSSKLVLSQPANGKSDSRQVTIYKAN